MENDFEMDMWITVIDEQLRQNRARLNDLAIWRDEKESAEGSDFDLFGGYFKRIERAIRYTFVLEARYGQA